MLVHIVKFIKVLSIIKFRLQGLFTMKTTQDVIADYQALPPEEQQVVVEFFESNNGGEFKPTNYSAEIMAELDKDAKEAKKGINVDGPFQGKEAVEFLRKLGKS
jgi:hypothetical protein